MKTVGYLGRGRRADSCRRRERFLLRGERWRGTRPGARRTPGAAAPAFQDTESIEGFIKGHAGFLTVVCFGSSPTSSFPPVSSTDDNQEDRVSYTTCLQESGGAKSYDRKKAWSSISHTILSGRAEQLFLYTTYHL